MMLMCQKDNFWYNLCDAIDRKDLKESSKFKNLKGRYENKEELLKILKAIFIKKTTNEWICLLKENDVPCAPVNKFEEVFNDPHLISRELIIEVDHPKFGKIKELACPIRVVGENQKKQPAAAYGENTEEILKNYLNASSDDIEKLKSVSAI
jgi:crotonobetainyl-CoA:carnitine CoA-transferase CaiB-like acyl-CoA transferase